MSTRDDQMAVADALLRREGAKPQPSQQMPLEWRWYIKASILIIIGILAAAALLSPALWQADCQPRTIDNQTGLWCPDTN